jgi:hypothetical protein
MLSWPNLKCYVNWKGCEGTFHDKFELTQALQQIRMDAVMTEYEVLFGLEQMWKNAVMT